MIDLRTIPFTIADTMPPLLGRDTLDEGAETTLIGHALSLIGKKYRTITLSDYREYNLTGDRSHYQNLVEERNTDLSDLLFAAFYDEGQQFIPPLLDLLYLITGETAWWLPAHNLYQRDVRTNDYPDTTRPVICIHATETAALLATAVTLLKDKLPAETVTHVKAEIERRIFSPYETFHFWWMGDGVEKVNNWGPWCVQNVLLCYALLVDDKERKRKAIAQAVKTLQFFLDGYGEDGGCEEGPNYYHHAACSLFSSLWVLDMMTDNAFSNVYQERKIRNMASFIEKAHIKDDWYVNFSDSPARLEPNGLNVYLFAKATGNGNLMAFVQNDWKRQDKETRLLLSTRFILERIMTNRTYTEAMASQKNYQEREVTDHFPSIGLHVFKTKTYVLAVNAGNNGVSHNHNDTGSVILFKEGKPVLIDVGVETYTKKTFSPERYAIWTMQDRYHNLTAFTPYHQDPGERFKATDIHATVHTITMELKDAYQKELRLTGYKRSVTISNEGVTIKDEVRCGEKHVFTMMSLFPPERTEKGILMGNAEITAPGTPETEAIPLTDMQLRASWGETIYRTRIPYNETIEVHIV